MFSEERPEPKKKPNQRKPKQDAEAKKKAHEAFQLEDDNEHPPEQDESAVAQSSNPDDNDTDHEDDDAPVGNLFDLPSKGRLGYPSQISYRDVMAGDEEVLKTATRANYVRTLNRVLKSICNDVDWFYDMSTHDRDFIVTHIWSNTYSPMKELTVSCNACGNKDDISIDMREVDVDDISDKIKPTFPITIKKTGETVKMRMITLRDENNAEKYFANTDDDDTTMETVLATCALDMKKPMTTKDRVQWWKDNVSAREGMNIKQYHRTFKFGLDTLHEHECTKCGEVTSGRIPFRIDDIIAPDVPSDFEELLLSD